MSALQVTARLKIHEGKLDEFKQVAAQCMQSVREKDSGTLQYDWFFNDDQTECVVRETYRDSDAVLEHIGNLGEIMGALLGVSDMDLEVFGTPSDELAEAAAELAPRVYSPFQSI
ncbi:MAG: antibiotic biosynthesis monooxygenase [Gemmatimonadota bacterium]